MRLLIVFLLALPLGADTTITLLHFSDYHSHALPFYTDEGMRGGIARAVGYLRREKEAGALVFSGGDMINKGAPTWSDEYQCAEWPWLNGIVSAMAFGNHEPDYGRAALERCRARLKYPILSANTPDFRPFAVFKTKGVRVGVFAVAGPDFPKLVKDYTFSDSVEAARRTVAALRRQADVVVMIGHQSTEADYALARAVPGIDVIFGTHSHRKENLVPIEGTKTAFISPWQYLTYISRVEVTVGEGRVKQVRGGLVPVDESMLSDRTIEKRVARMQADLERKRPEQFAVIATLDQPLTTEALARRTLAIMREAVHADVAVSTTSSFRGALAAGGVTLETLSAALPYDNELVVCTMTDAQLRSLLGESYVTDFEPRSEYRVATTDYLANVAYKFTCEKSGLRVRTLVRNQL
jgi:5'-nucleotidase